MSPNIFCAILIVLLPLSAYIIQTAVGKRLPRMGDWVSTGAIFAAFCLATKIFISMWTNYSPDWVESAHWTWLDIGTAAMPLKLEVGIHIDNITAIMLFMVTLCSTLIHLFSTGYMRDHHGKPADGYRYASFFSFLSLFTAGMLGLIVSDNLFTLFMCWELMGLCSYLLIGFYRHKISAANASLKAFMTTRIGDTGLFIGMLLLFTFPLVDGTSLGSFRFEDIYAAISSGAFQGELLGMPVLFWLGLLIFCGTVGKSAQFPLQIWLPDAMEGPTPVSALIHAATMVAAGVYLVIRMFPILEAGHVLTIVAYVGAITSLFAAILAMKQYDIKKVLAYSTLSQLGYMVLALGVGDYKASFFHLITHALFKACLFMASGAVIYAMHHEQDMRKMGGLWKKLPITFATMLIATLAISGVPGLSGFVSKDQILVSSLAFWKENPAHFFVPIAAFITAGLTAFYMFRLIFMTFFGKAHDKHHYDEAHEVPVNMWIPLAVLASLSFGVLFTGSLSGGLFGHKGADGHYHGDFIFGHFNGWFNHLVTVPRAFAAEHYAHFEHLVHEMHGPGMYTSILLASLGILFSWMVFSLKKPSPEFLSKLVPGFVHKAIDNLYFFDWFYIKVFIKKLFLPVSKLFSVFDDSVIDGIAVDGWKNVVNFGKKLSSRFDDVIIDGVLVDGVGGKLPSSLGSNLSFLQNGKIQRYLFVAAGALALLLVFKGVL